MSKAKTAKENHSKNLQVTILDILHDGKKTEPFRAIASHAGQSYMVISRTALDINIGDDLYATGILKKSNSRNIPHEFFISEPKPTQNRAKKILDDKAEIHSFNTDNNKPRPALITADKLQLHPLKTLKNKGHYATISPLKTSTNPTLQTALDIFKDVKIDKPIYLIDPEIALTNIPYRGLGWDVEEMLSKDMKKLLQKSSPNAFQGDALQQGHGHDILHPAGRMCPIITGLTGGKIQTSALVTPYTPYSTSTDIWRGMSGLDGTLFAPKTNIDNDMSRLGTLLHELAHAVQDKYGMKPLGTDLKDDSARNLRENFADSFEILALIKHHGKKALPFINMMITARSASLYSGKLCHATAKGQKATLKEALELLNNGKLKDKSTENLLKIAAKIAKEQAYSKEEIKSLTKKREAIYENAGCYTTPYENSTFKQFDHLKAWQAFKENAAKTDPNLADCLTAIKTSFYTPDELINNPKIREKALEIYKEDLEISYNNFGWKETAIRNAQDTHDMNFSLYNSKDMPEIENFSKSRSKIRESYNHDSRRKKNKDIKTSMTEEMALITKTPAHRHHDIAKAYSLSPELRLTEWKKLVKTTLKAIDNNDLKTAQKLDSRRHDYAFAIRSDSKTWEKLKSRHPAALIRQIASDTSNLQLAFTKSHAANIKKRLLAAENMLSNQRPKDTKSHNPPKPSI